MKLRRATSVALSINIAYAVLALSELCRLLWSHLHDSRSAEHELVLLTALLILLWSANAARILCPLRRNTRLQTGLNIIALLAALAALPLGFVDPVAWMAPVSILPPALSYLIVKLMPGR